MWGAIAGDVIGSYFEHVPTKSTQFYLFREESTFTDDTVLTVAVADWLLHDTDLVSTLQRYVRRYPDAGYGHTFLTWAQLRQRMPYQSWGNGSAMRVSPVAYAAETMADCLYLAKKKVSRGDPQPSAGNLWCSGHGSLCLSGTYGKVESRDSGLCRA